MCGGQNKANITEYSVQSSLKEKLKSVCAHFCSYLLPWDREWAT
jgi:hypothetical protein